MKFNDTIELFYESMILTSAGILLYHLDNELKVFLVHPGGPYYRNKDDGSWSIPKGKVEKDETDFEGALREFKEETGITIDSYNKSKFIDLGSIFTTEKNDRIFHMYAYEGTGKEVFKKSNKFKMEWPPRSGKKQEFDEIEYGQYFEISEARLKINPKQLSFLNKLEKKVYFTLWPKNLFN